MTDFKIIIIGGGPAGTASAAYLTKLGIDVCIIEKKNFPRETLCGEFLSNEVENGLRELNLFEEFLSLKPNSINSFRFISAGENEFYKVLGFTAYSIKRSVFDNFLFYAAKAKGANLLFPAEVKTIRKDGDKFIVNITDSNGKNFNLSSKIVIAAYGKQNFLDKYLKRNFANVKSNTYGVKFHVDKKYFKHFNENEIRIYSNPGLYCGMNAVNSDTVNICLLRKGIESKESPRKLISEFISGTESFRTLFNPGGESIFNSLPVWGCGNIFFGKKSPVENGIFIAGDAAGVIAPLAGDGIGMAFQSAKILSSVLDGFLRNKISRREAEEIYTLKWNSLFRKRILTASIIQKIILNHTLGGISTGLLKFYPGILPQLIKLTRG